MTVLTAARARFRVVRDNDPGFVLLVSPEEDADGRILEFWPKGESESPDPTHWLIETFGHATVLDVAGDIASHYLRVYDERTRAYYQAFARSLNSSQHARLEEQYEYAVANEGEARPFAVWARLVGIPAYFRGLPFQQGWPPSLYTLEQRNMLAQMLRYLRTGRGTAPRTVRARPRPRPVTGDGWVQFTPMRPTRDGLPLIPGLVFPSERVVAGVTATLGPAANEHSQIVGASFDLWLWQGGLGNPDDPDFDIGPAYQKAVARAQGTLPVGGRYDWFGRTVSAYVLKRRTAPVNPGSTAPEWQARWRASICIAKYGDPREYPLLERFGFGYATGSRQAAATHGVAPYNRDPGDCRFVADPNTYLADPLGQWDVVQEGFSIHCVFAH